MAATFWLRTPNLWLLIIIFISSSTGKPAANPSSSKTGETFNERDVRGGQEREELFSDSNSERNEAVEDVLSDLQWVTKTIDVLQEVLSSLGTAAKALRIINETSEYFNGKLGCQIPHLEGNTAEVGKTIVQHFIDVISAVNTEADGKDLEGIVTEFHCLHSVFNEITEEVKQGKYGVSQIQHGDIHGLIAEAEAHAKSLLEEFNQRQHTLRETLKLLDDVLLYNEEKNIKFLQNVGPVSTTPVTTEPESMKYDRMTLIEIRNLLAKYSNALHSTLFEISLLIKKQKAVKDAVALSEAFQEELKTLEETISSSDASTIDWGILKISHGPYCEGLIKTGLILELFYEMLEDAINATVALAEAHGTEEVKSATEAATCRTSAVATVVSILPGKLNADEISKVSVGLNNSRLKVEESHLKLTEYSQNIEKRMEVLLLQKNKLRSNLTEIRLIILKIMSQPTLRQVDDLVPARDVVVNISQSYN